MTRATPTWLVAAVAAYAALGACNDYDIVKQPMRETFYQAQREKIDLLFVIDDSPSMFEEAASIETATTALLYTLVQLEVDTRVRSVSTSSNLLVDWTSVETLDQVPDLVARSAVEADGIHDEAGLAIAVEFTGTVRTDATLHVTIISDEDDASPNPVTSYTEALTDRTTAGARIHPITGDLPAGCAHDGLAADPSPRYADAAVATDGTALSICSAALGTELEALSFELTGLLDRFPLSSIPDPASLAVWVETAQVPRSPVHGWRWNAAANAIEFDGFAIPPPGALIEVEYDVALPDAGTGVAELPTDTATPESP